MFSLSLQVQQYYKDSHHETSESDSGLHNHLWLSSRPPIPSLQHFQTRCLSPSSFQRGNGSNLIIKQTDGTQQGTFKRGGKITIIIISSLKDDKLGHCTFKVPCCESRVLILQIAVVSSLLGHTLTRRGPEAADFELRDGTKADCRIVGRPTSTFATPIP